MDLKKGVMIKNKFGTKTPGRYILRYTSREDATESLDVENYITKYTTRYNAVEQMKYEAPEALEVLSRDESIMRKDGVLFGNRGLSYTDGMLKDAARTTQKAVDEGHVVMLPIISFDHEYLVEQGIVPEDMPEPTQAGEYKGKVDQLKLRRGISDMMRTMHKDMGFNEPEWTGTIQLDTKHVHVHLTTVETGKPLPQRMKSVRDKQESYEPSMDWSDDDKVSPVEKTFDERGFALYKRDDEVVARQRVTAKGNPKWEKIETPTDRMVKVERGVINDRSKTRMRYSLNRSLNKTKNVYPLVKDVYDKRMLTKTMTKNTAFYNSVTAEKLQALQASLPENTKMWRADSNAKAMQRPNEIANEVVDDLWTRHDNGVRLSEFDNSVMNYIDTRQEEEGFSDEYRQQLYKGAYNRLRKETINGIYRDMKTLDKEKKTVEIPKYSIQATSTEALQNEIADMHLREEKPFDQMTMYEYRQRSYNDRLTDAMYQSDYYRKEVSKYDMLRKDNKTAKESAGVREHYMQEYLHYTAVSDKYAYLSLGEKESGVSKNRFKEVKGTDLINMLYDYGPNDDRSIPHSVSSQYKKQTQAREKAMDKTMDYLVLTGQVAQYEMMKEKRDEMRKESLFADQIEHELSMPVPRRASKASLETRKTIDTYEGRKMLRSEIGKIEKLTKDMRMDYEDQTDFELVKTHKAKRKDNTLQQTVDWSKPETDKDIQKQHQQEYQVWAIRRMQFEQFQRDEERRRKEEEIEAEIAAQQAQAEADAASAKQASKEEKVPEANKSDEKEPPVFTLDDRGRDKGPNI